MCGIAGCCDTENGVQANTIEAMLNSLVHRGPDDEGYVALDGKGCPFVGKDSQVAGTQISSASDQKGFLAHRRLSILDVSSAGHQPMQFKETWLVFNGEIYNYVELRDQLKNNGYEFKTGTDTEVVLAAYDFWGEDCLSHFNGMWAFVLYDAKKNCLFGSRDRFGVKPFYYINKGSFFAFASEIKAFSPLKKHCAFELNESAVFDYLAFTHFSYDESTLLSPILELMPSHKVTFDLTTAQLKLSRYYELKTSTVWKPFDSFEQNSILSVLKKSLRKSVALRLRADVPVGACLSGGLDSSLLVCLMSELLKEQGQKAKDLQIFTVGFDSGAPDERPWAKMVIDHVGATWHCVTPTADGLKEDVEAFAYAQDIPLGSLSPYNDYVLMRKAKQEGLKVLFDGQGADEVFGGYKNYVGVFYNELLKNGQWGALATELSHINDSPVNLGYLLYSFLKHRLPVGLSEQALYRKNPLMPYIQPDVLKNHKHMIHQRFEKKTVSLNGMLKDDLLRAIKLLFHMEDRNSMAFSIESRVPFGDDVDLIDYAFQLPSAYKIHKGKNKYILREAARGIVPDAICDRKDKVGFTAADVQWLNAHSEFWKSILPQELDRFVDLKNIKKNWTKLLHSPASGSLMWRVIHLGLFMKRVGN